MSRKTRRLRAAVNEAERQVRGMREQVRTARAILFEERGAHGAVTDHLVLAAQRGQARGWDFETWRNYCAAAWTDAESGRDKGVLSESG